MRQISTIATPSDRITELRFWKGHISSTSGLQLLFPRTTPYGARYKTSSYRNISPNVITEVYFDSTDGSVVYR
jgi:hypothetical protein